MDENEELSDWETLCKECSEAAQKAGITKEDTDRIIKEVREKITEYEKTGIMDLEMQRLEETFNLVYELTKIRMGFKEFSKALQKDIKRTKTKVDEITKEHENPNKTFNYYGGWTKGYFQGRLSALEDIQDKLNELFKGGNSNDNK